MKPRILLTGFTPWASFSINPSQRLMEAISDKPYDFPSTSVRSVVLDVDFVLCEKQFRKTIDEYRPHAVLSFGLSQHQDSICVERIALNLDSSITPDNSGVVRDGVRIVTDGPAAYWVTTPVEEIVTALQSRGIPAVGNGYAGGSLCNHVLYYGLHLAAKHQAWKYKMGFIHVPPFPEQIQKGWKSKKGMQLPKLCEAAKQIVNIVALSLKTK
jgi:pyroglutamyl-peptidase